MATTELALGNHQIIVTTVPLADGGFTLTIVHRERRDREVVESKFDSGIAYSSEDEALSHGVQIAKNMVERVGR